MTPEALAQIYVDVFSDMVGGKNVQIDEDNDVVVKAMGMGTFFVSLDAERDPEFMRLVFPNFYSTDISNESLVLNAANTVNRENKAVKLVVRNRDNELSVSAAIEAFVASPDEAPSKELLAGIMERCFKAILAGASNFANAVKAGV